jgi:hypothetical protein
MHQTVEATAAVILAAAVAARPAEVHAKYPTRGALATSRQRAAQIERQVESLNGAPDDKEHAPQPQGPEITLATAVEQVANALVVLAGGFQRKRKWLWRGFFLAQTQCFWWGLVRKGSGVGGFSHRVVFVHFFYWGS